VTSILLQFRASPLELPNNYSTQPKKKTVNGRCRPMTKDELQRIEQLCRGVTPGPWKASIEGRDHMSGCDVVLTGHSDIELVGMPPGDVDFIAAARQVVPRLVAEVRRLQALVGK
ncbi:MAG: hypothetical protein ACI82G_003001, partial [Bradymonadia bacterium]